MFRIVASLTWLALASCDSQTLSFTTPVTTCSRVFGDASDDCPPSACPFSGFWQHAGMAGDTLPCSPGAIGFDGTTGNVSQLTSSGWAVVDHFTTCANHARATSFHMLFAPALPAGCGPACDVSLTRPSGSSACDMHVDMPCEPSPANGGALSLTLLYYPCAP